MASQDSTPVSHGLLRYGPPSHLGYWDEHPIFPSEDWQFEVGNGDTREGYWNWVYSKVEASKEQGNMESEQEGG